MSINEKVEQFYLALCDLKLNSKPMIAMLTLLADEGKQSDLGIANVIKERVYEVESNSKLPLLYLIDSICKNLGLNYINLFEPSLVKLFVHVYLKGDLNKKNDMIKLRNTWKKLFKEDTLNELDQKMRIIYSKWPFNNNNVNKSTSEQSQTTSLAKNNASTKIELNKQLCNQTIYSQPLITQTSLPNSILPSNQLVTSQAAFVTNQHLLPNSNSNLNQQISNLQINDQQLDKQINQQLLSQLNELNNTNQFNQPAIISQPNSQIFNQTSNLINPTSILVDPSYLNGNLSFINNNNNSFLNVSQSNFYILILTLIPILLIMNFLVYRTINIEIKRISDHPPMVIRHIAIRRIVIHLLDHMQEAIVVKQACIVNMIMILI